MHIKEKMTKRMKEKKKKTFFFLFFKIVLNDIFVPAKINAVD